MNEGIKKFSSSSILNNLVKNLLIQNLREYFKIQGNEDNQVGVINYFFLIKTTKNFWC